MNQDEKTSSCNSNGGKVENESVSKTSPLDENNFKVKATTNITEGFYNLVFPLRFIALKNRCPDMYRQLLELESHLEERKQQVKMGKVIFDLENLEIFFNIRKHEQPLFSLFFIQNGPSYKSLQDMADILLKYANNLAEKVKGKIPTKMYLRKLYNYK